MAAIKNNGAYRCGVFFRAFFESVLQSILDCRVDAMLISLPVFKMHCRVFFDVLIFCCCVSEKYKLHLGKARGSARDESTHGKSTR